MQKLVEGLAHDLPKLSALRAEFDALAEPCYRDNQLKQDYLLTRAKAR